MAYITEADILKRVGQDKLVQLTDNAGTGEVDHERVAQAIAAAEGTINSGLRARYSIPVPATEEVRNRCLHLAIFDLYTDRATDNEGVYKVRKDQADAAIAWLKALQRGEAALDVPAADETKENPGTSDQVLSGPSTPAKFSDKNLRGF
jgi:phage gp36-like protein